MFFHRSAHGLSAVCQQSASGRVSRAVVTDRIP
jgi:hypothetical protein